METLSLPITGLPKHFSEIEKSVAYCYQLSHSNTPYWSPRAANANFGFSIIMSFENQYYWERRMQNSPEKEDLNRFKEMVYDELLIYYTQDRPHPVKTFEIAGFLSMLQGFLIRTTLKPFSINNYN